MLLHTSIHGDKLPQGTVCLTYDDGPGETADSLGGPHTMELGRFLHQEGIRATFFVIGRHAERFPHTLERLHGWKHIIGNHTYSHPGLVRFVQDGHDAIAELRRTHELIAPFTNGNRIYFRPPYGNWREKSDPTGPEDAPTSVVADALNGSGLFANYVGPVLWDIVAEDWACWREGISPKECAERYLSETERIGRGIILMHDSSEEDDVRPKNRTEELTKLLVPMLKRRSYRFAALDEFLR
ncbi:MAG TPA: polysaccharide deacetylase family protein [Pirellulales bacterium]|nr:polysaccharide deacetylase family protein [Pirellulales bacterium]